MKLFKTLICLFLLLFSTTVRAGYVTQPNPNQDIIALSGIILPGDDEKFAKLIDQIEANNPNHHRILILISSPGGDVDTMWNIVHKIESVQDPVDTYAISECASAAVTIFVTGQHRYSTGFNIFVTHYAYYINKHNKKVEEEDVTDKIIDEFVKCIHLSFSEIHDVFFHKNHAFIFNKKFAETYGIVTDDNEPLPTDYPA